MNNSNTNESTVTSIERKRNPYYLGMIPKGNRFPSATVPVRSVKVDMAVGMYQFHDLMASHKPYFEMTEDDLNNNDIGVLNLG